MTVPTPATRGRAAGLLVPLFSLHSRASWGIGEIGDIAPFARWLDGAGLQMLQLLPVGEVPSGETSPYAALSAMALDPVYISLDAVSDFVSCGGEPRLGLAEQAALRRARGAARVRYAEVRRAKEAALRLAFSGFWDVDWTRGTARAGTFAMFCLWEEWWLADYALYRALRDRYERRSWTEWPAGLRDRDPDALADARRELEREILYYQYVQWLADEQWERAREQARPVRLIGDFPFMVSGDSADVWARQHLFRFDRTIGTPPDAFSETGQDWGMPVYRWDRMAAEDFGWLRQRARRAARLFDGFRIDHLVGFYRTYSRSLGAREGGFDPATEEEQRALGERLVGLFVESGADVIAEDLGLIPDFVRESIAHFGLPGYRVMRWERDAARAGHPFRDPADYPPQSVATTSTHDIEPLAEWWSVVHPDERHLFAAVPSVRRGLPHDFDARTAPYDPVVRDAVLHAAFNAGSETLLLPIQDVFGWTDRVNVPATVSDSNWTWRLPWSVDELGSIDEAQERAETLRRWGEESGRA